MRSETSAINKKLPIPVLFAVFELQLKGGQLGEALKLLNAHIDRKFVDKVHILIYNLTKIHELQGNTSKQIFSLEKLLK